MTDKKFRLTIHHDEDSAHLNPNEEDNLFRLHSFSTRHISYTDPDKLLACNKCGEDKGDHPIRDYNGRFLCVRYEGPEGFPLSYFEHGLCRWSLAGEMDGAPDFRWDGVRIAGFLEVVVSDSERGWWDEQTPEFKVEVARGFVETYTEWCNGEVYGYTLERVKEEVCSLGFTHELQGDEDLDSCWGFIGFDYFQEAVREATSDMGATEEETEIVDRAFGSAEYGKFFQPKEEVSV